MPRPPSACIIRLTPGATQHWAAPVGSSGGLGVCLIVNICGQVGFNLMKHLSRGLSSVLLLLSIFMPGVAGAAPTGGSAVPIVRSNVKAFCVFLLLSAIALCGMPRAWADVTDTQVDTVENHFHFVNSDGSGIDHDTLKHLLLQQNGSYTYLAQGLRLCELMDMRDTIANGPNHFYQANSSFDAAVETDALGYPSFKDNAFQNGLYVSELVLSAFFPPSAGIFTTYDTFEQGYAAYQLVNTAVDQVKADAINNLVKNYIAVITDPDNDQDDWDNTYSEVLKNAADPIQNYINSHGGSPYDLHEFCKLQWRLNQFFNTKLPGQIDAYKSAVNQAIGGGAVITYALPYAPAQMTFNGSFSKGRYGNAITSYQWKVDGAAAGTTSSISQTFWQPGSHTVALTVTDAGNYTQSASESFTVRSPVIDVAVDYVNRKGTFTVPSNSLVTLYTWDFGDGHTQPGAALNQVSHTYVDGDYTVKLTIHSQQGNDITSSTVVHIQRPTPRTYTWTGGSTTDPTYWYDVSNWSPGGIPNQLDTVNFNGGNGMDIPSGFTLNWTGGTLTGTMNVTQGAHLNISGDTDKFINNATLNNAGATNWIGSGNISCYGGNINNSGVFEVQNDAICEADSSGPSVTFNNTGTFTKSAGSGVTQFWNFVSRGGYSSGPAYQPVIFQTSGIVNVNSGTVTIRQEQ